VSDSTATGRALVTAADAAAARGTLGLAQVATSGAYADLTGKPLPPPSTLRSGRNAVWPWGPSLAATARTDRTSLAHFLVPQPFSFGSVGLTVTTAAAGASIVVGLYDYTDTTAILVAQWGSIDASTTGEKVITGARSITTGAYLIGMRAVGAGATVAGAVVSSASPMLGPNAFGGTPLSQAAVAMDFYATGPTALPATINLADGGNFETGGYNGSGAPLLIFRGVTTP
jgi:hypothetical protein